MNIDSNVLIAGLVTSAGLIFLMIGLSSGSATSNPLAGISGYGESAWDDDRNMAAIDMVEFKTQKFSPLTRAFQAWRDSQKQKRPKAAAGDEVSPMARKLMLAQIQMTPLEWTTTRLMIGGAVSGLAYYRFGSLIPAVMGALAVFFITKIVVNMRANKRQMRFERQLIDVIGVIGAGMRAGSTFNQAIEYVAGHVDPPAGPEFARLSREAQFGIPMDECLAHLAQRNDSNELRLLVNAIVVNRRVGGNMSSILEILADTIRMRIKIKGDIKTLTAQASFSGWIISLLPVALLGILMLISPAYVGPMFTNGVGQGILGAAGFSVLMGMFLMRKVTKVAI